MLSLIVYVMHMLICMIVYVKAELRPIAEGETNDYSQTDEEDMGMSYTELGIFGVLRKIHRCGPVSMFLKLVQTWSNLAPIVVAEKVTYSYTQIKHNYMCIYILPYLSYILIFRP